MEPKQIVKDAQIKLNQSVEHFKESLQSIRTSRASSSMLEGVMVEAYGVPMPLNQLANVTAPEAQLLQITPFDPNNIQAISTAIRANQSLGFNPSDDGRVVRIVVPPLTEERRKDLTKQVNQKQEDCMVGLRGIRREAMSDIDTAKKDKLVGEDEAKRLSQQIEDLMSSVQSEVEKAAQAKSSEIMTI
jgi:ribosome recycling factor